MSISQPAPSQHGLPFNETRGGSSRSLKSAGSFNNGQRIGGAVAIPTPRRRQSPARGAMRAASLLDLPPASVGGAFPAGVKESLMAEPTGIAGWLLRCGMGVSPFQSAACVQEEVGGVSGACSASQCGENRAQLVARQNQRCHSPCGGTKRPRAFPRSGGQPLHPCALTAAPRQAAQVPGGAGVPSAARAFSRPVTAKASSKTGLHPRLKRPAMLESPRYAAGPSLWPAFDLSGHTARPPRPMPGATGAVAGFGVGSTPQTAAPLNGANQTEGAAA